MKYGFVKVAAATPIIRVSDCKKNTDAIIAQIKEANIEGAALVNFPELCITGYTCSDVGVYGKNGIPVASFRMPK